MLVSLIILLLTVYSYSDGSCKGHLAFKGLLNAYTAYIMYLLCTGCCVYCMRTCDPYKGNVVHAATNLIHQWYLKTK